MPKHKKDKRAKSIAQSIGPDPSATPPPGAQAMSAEGDSKAFQQHDAENRLGSFTGTGNHPRTGNPGHQ